MRPRTLTCLTAFVWTCAIMAIAIMVAYLPLIQGILWWVWGIGEQPK